MNEKVVVIVGPTAVGKTKLSIDLAKKFNGEIISGDSMQVYKGMDIGTDKISLLDMEEIPHYMIDIVNPDEPYTVAQFQEQVRYYIKELNKNSKLPIIVGGSGLYIDAILYDYNFENRKRNEEITNELEEIYKNEGIDSLYKELQRVDREQADKIHPNNVRRVIRALEIYKTTGKTMTEIHKRQKRTSIFNHKTIGLEMNREILYNQINHRIDLMIDKGLIDEVKMITNQFGFDALSLKAIGYKEIIPYILGENDLNSCIDTLKKNTRHYAKRQMTWFKNKMDVQWYQLNKDHYEQSLQTIQSEIIDWLN